jgi:TrkA domain protein
VQDDCAASQKEQIMFDDEDVEISETRLPGIGMRHDFLIGAGRRVGVVSHRNGQRDLVVFSKDDPDSCSQVLQMSAAEADALAQFLGSGRIVEKLASLSEQISSLATGKVRIAHGSRYDGLTLGATKARTRTSSSIVALMRDKEVIPSPGPETPLHGGDTLVVVGTPEGIDQLKDIVAE